MKAKRDLGVLPPTHGALELHITRTNYQPKTWLQADHVIMDLENEPSETIYLWQEGTDCLLVVWKCLPVFSVVPMKPISCLCKSKCKSMR